VANEIKLTISVDDKGSLKIVAKDADKAAKSTDKATKSARRLKKEVEGVNVKYNQHNKLEKGTAQLGANSTKSFSKMSQTLGGTLVPAYATLAANIFALTAALGALRRAAAVEQLKQGLVEVGTAAGQNLPYLATQLKEITGYAVSTQEAMASVALGISSGFSGEQLKDLTKVAKGASLALGRNMEDALSRLVRGTAKLEPEILDELGIMVRLDQATTEYAASIGKTATQLTQFERRHAFLNATIEQGLEKFSEIADAVDPNPYDRLAAAFDDLSKAGFKVINFILSPIIELMASTPTALMGVLALFGTTIINKIVPGLRQLANEQRDLAASTAIHAQAAAAASVDAFKAAAAKITVPKVAPKAALADTAALKAGALSYEEMRKKVLSLTRSEELRQGWLRTWAKEQHTHSKQYIANKEKEIAEIRRFKAEILSTMKLEQATGKISQESVFARTQSRIAKRQAKYLDAINNAGALGGLKVAGKGIKRHFSEINKVTGATKKWAIASRFLSSSLTLVGRSLLNLIPAVGQLLFAWSLLHSAYKALRGESGKLDAKIKEITKSFDSMLLSGEKLQILFEESDDPLKKFFNTLKIGAGFTEQVKQGLSDLNNATTEHAANEIRKLIEERVELHKQFNKPIENALVGITFFGKSISEYKARYDELGVKITEIRKQAKLLDEDAALTVLQTALENTIAVSGDAKNLFKPLQDGIVELQQKILDGAITTKTEFAEAFETLNDQGLKSYHSITAAADANAQLQKEQVKLFTKQITPIDRIVDSVQTLANEFSSAGEVGKEGFELFLKDTSEFNALLEKSALHLATLKNEAKGLKIPDTGEAALKQIGYNEAVQYTTGIYKEYQKTLLETSGTIKKLGVELKLFSKIKALSPEAAKASLEAQKQILKERIREKQVLQEMGNEENRKKLAKEISALETAINVIKTRNSEIDIARINIEQKHLKYVEKITKDLLAASQAKLKIARNEVELLAVSQNRNIATDENLKLFKEESRIRLSTAEAEYQISLSKIKNETDLLLLQNEIQRKQAELSGFDTSGFDKLASLIEASGENAIIAAEARRNEVQSTEELTRLEKIRAYRAEELRLTYNNIQQSADLLTLSELNRAASAKKLELAQQKAAEASADLLNTVGSVQAKEIARQKAVEASLEVYKQKIDLLKTEEEFQTRILDLQQEIVQSILEASEAQSSIIDSEIKLSAILQDRELNPEDELAIYKAQAQIRKNTIEFEYQSTVDRVDLETKSLIAEMILRRTIAKIQYPEIDVGDIDRLITLTARSAQQSKITAANRRQEALAAESLASAELERLNITAQLELVYSTISSQVEYLRVIEEEQNALKYEAINLTLQEQILTEKLVNTEENSLARELARQELIKTQTQLLKNQLNTIKAQFAYKRDILDLNQQITQSFIETSKASLEIERTLASIKVLMQGGTELNAQEELELFKKQKDRRLELANLELNMTKHRLSLESEARLLDLEARRTALLDNPLTQIQAQALAVQALEEYKLNSIALRTSKEKELEEQKMNSLQAQANIIYDISKQELELQSILLSYRLQAEQKVAAERFAFLEKEIEFRKTGILEPAPTPVIETKPVQVLDTQHLEALKRLEQDNKTEVFNNLEAQRLYQLDTVSKINKVSKTGIIVRNNLEKESAQELAKITTQKVVLPTINLPKNIDKTDKETLKQIEAQINKEEELAKSQQIEIDTQRKLIELQLKEEELRLKSQLADEARLVVLDQITNQAELARIASNERLALSMEAKRLDLERLFIATELALADEGSLRQAQLEIELEKKKLEILTNQVEAIREMANNVKEIAGEGSSVGYDMIANLDAAFASLTDSSTTEKFSEKIRTTIEAMSPMLEHLKSLGPEGELMGLMFESAFLLTETWSDTFEKIKEAGGLTAESLASVFSAAAAAIGAISSIQQMQSRNRIAGIDKEIEAEKKRDGASAKSIARIQALEKKKEAQKKKAFEDNKKMLMAQVVMSTAAGIMKAIEQGGIWGIAFGAIIAAIGAAQLAVISGMTYEGGGASTSTGPSKVSLGERKNTVDVARSQSPAGELAFMRGERGIGNTGATNFMPTGAFTGRAAGGNTAVLVGEQGPELFIPDRPGSILPADETEQLTEQLNVNFSINTIDTQGMEDALIRQRGNIIGMIREAANSKGEFFLENVNVREDDAL
jgi:hypothetical protein